jgi:hypothetical protein
MMRIAAIPCSKHRYAILIAALVLMMSISSAHAKAANATIGGCIYTGAGSVTYSFDPLTGEPIAHWDTAYAPDPRATPITNAQVMVQNQHSGGAFIKYGAVSGNCWSATVPAPGDYVVMFSAPDHDSTSRSFTVSPGDNQTQDAYLPPLADLDGEGILNDLPRANLLMYVFYDKKVNGNDDGALIDPPLNGVTVTAKDEHGNVVGTCVTGTQGVINTADGLVINPSDGYCYLTGLPPGELRVSTDPSGVTQAANPGIAFGDPNDATRQFYLTYTEEGGADWEVNLSPGDPGTEAGAYLLWHGYIEKLGQIGSPTNPNPIGACTINGTLLDADGTDPAEPFPTDLGGRVIAGDPMNPGLWTPVGGSKPLDVRPNERVVNGALALYTVGDFPNLIATTEADPVTGVFNFHNIPPGKYELFAWDLPLDYVPLIGVGVTINPGCANASSFPIMMARFFARAQGRVMNNGSPVAGATVKLQYKSGVIKDVTTTDANGWFNFNSLPEIEVMGHVLVDLPDKSTYRGKIVTEEFQGGPNGNVMYTHNAMNRYVQWYTLNYYVDLEVENIPTNVGDIHGVVFYDHLAPGSWVGNGLYDEREEPTLQGVKVQLYQKDPGTGKWTNLVAETTTGAFDKAATINQGWMEPYTYPPDEIGGVFAGPSLGFYEFRDLAPGKYRVKVVPPKGFTRSPARPVKVPVRVLRGKSREVNLGLTTMPKGATFGVPLAGEIEGGVFDDMNLDTNLFSLLYMEKAGIIDAPVGVYDHYNYLLGWMPMGNPYCYSNSFVCPPGEPLGQKPEAERRFAPGVHRYLGNDPSQPGYNEAYYPFELAYSFGQGAYKFEADWSLIPRTAADMDSDGYTTFGLNGALDCNDYDPNIYPATYLGPGAPETLGDGIDQDCSGFDLTITVTLARYKTADQKFIVMATSTDGAGANLMAKIPGRRPKPMKWNAAKNRWQKTFVNVPAPPATVTVSGPGVDSVTVDVTDIRP